MDIIVANSRQNLLWNYNKQMKIGWFIFHLIRRFGFCKYWILSSFYIYLKKHELEPQVYAFLHVCASMEFHAGGPRGLGKGLAVEIYKVGAEITIVRWW